MASKSRFYVDTPRDPPQRHSMLVTHAELAQRQDLSSNSSSATLPSTAGSVDRLTGLEEKKSSRFFTLKPKTSFSLRPFFRSTSSLISQSPGKRRKALLERRDSGVQTEEIRPEFGEVGVQTLNASTVDVPVQTCLEAWEEGDSYKHRRFAYATPRTSPFWSRPSVSSSALSNSLLPKNVAKDPLASPKLIKYVAPGDSEKAVLHHQSALSPVDVNSCQAISPPSHSVTSSAQTVPVKYFSAKELTSNAVSLSVSPEGQQVNKLQSVPTSECNRNSNFVPSDLSETLKENSSNLNESETSKPQSCTVLDNQPLEVSENLKYPISQNTDHPLSALRTERTDSPSRRLKTVHFDLSGSNSSLNLSNDSSKPRNIDKDFEALLRDLNVLTEDENDLTVSVNPTSREIRPPSNLVSPSLKSALDSLKEDFLAPIPENLNECNENEPDGETKLDNSNNLNKNPDQDIKVEILSVNSGAIPKKGLLIRSISEYDNQNSLDEKNKLGGESKLGNSDSIYKEADQNIKVEILSSSPEPSKRLSVRSISEYENQNSVEVNKSDSLSVTPTSLCIFTFANSGSNPETDSLERNVYDNVIKENSVKTVPLPTLPSFFEPPSHLQTAKTTEVVEYVEPSTTRDSPVKQMQPTMPLETEFDHRLLSRSSSRSSIKSSSKSRTDSCREPMNRFDSCENLDQLEEEIIRSLYSPDEGKLEEKIMQNIELPPSESFQNSGTTATHMRRVILDQLLSGKSVEDIVPNYPVYQRTHSVPETGSKFKLPTKYTAVLTKVGVDENSSLDIQKNAMDSPHNNSNSSSVVNLNAEKENNVTNLKYGDVSTDDSSPKRSSSVFLFSENTIPNGDNSEKSNFEISTVDNQNKISSNLEVRRSSWTPQATADSPSSSTGGKISPSKSKISENKAGECDFTNCLRPSKIQNSPFLAKINSRSMSPCNISPLPHQNPSPINHGPALKRNDSPIKPPEAVGECDFASCLKPSQVQNSLFKAELSEITSNKSTNSLRAGSPFTLGSHSPLPVKSTCLDSPSTTPISVEEKNDEEEESAEEVKHKSEFLITLKASDKHSNDLDLKSEMPQNTENIDNPNESVSEALQSNPSSDKLPGSEQQPTTDNFVPPPPATDNFVPPPSATDNFVPPPPAIDNFVPPPPPPPPASNESKSVTSVKDPISSMETMLQDQKSKLTVVEVPRDSRSATPKTPVMAELELRLKQDKNDSERRNSDDKTVNVSPTCSAKDAEPTTAGNSEIKLNGTPSYFSNGNQNGGIGILSEQREFGSSMSNGKNGTHSLGSTKLTFSPNTVITDEPPPPGAVLLDKKVTVDGDKVHTDKFFAIPVKEVLKEKTSTTKFIPAPPKYEGIGPTEDGIPIGLRNSVKKENMHNWYKTMFKSLHKADSSNDSQEYIIGYTSEPETSKKDMMIRKKSSTLDNRMKYDVNSNFNKQNYTPSVKSSIDVYNVRPRLIEDYEPGYSSITDDNVITSRRYLPSKNTVKPSYEFKNGYESDSNITRKRDQPEALSTEQQKMWYREIQKGGDIPQFGLGKQAPEKPKGPTIGPLPPPPLNYSTQPSYQQAVRPLTLPVDYSNQNGNGYCQQMNGAYEMQMRHAIHSEMQQRMSPSSNQLSPPNRTMMKSPSRSPDMKIPAQALFDFKAESPKEIPLKKGDTVLILRQLDKNWYEGEHKGVVGIFPISYVEIIPPEHASTPVKIRTEGLGKALFDFVAQTSIELTVRKGDTITLLRRVDANWFEGIFNSKKGIVPISYIQVIQEPADRNMNSPSHKSCSVSPSNLESKEKSPKPNSVSPVYTSNLASPLPVNLERRKLPNKKGSSLVEPMMYRALYSYSPQNSDELELQEGDNVCVVEMCDDGWYVGTSVRTGVFGIFPGNYVEKAC